MDVGARHWRGTLFRIGRGKKKNSGVPPRYIHLREIGNRLNPDLLDFIERELIRSPVV
jgi:hypothetical protein